MAAAWEKQRVEVLQILRALTWPEYGWKSHPAVLMWAGYEEALGTYGLVICREWCHRGHADSCDPKIRAELRGIDISSPRPQDELAVAGRLPPWLGHEEFHRSHRATLLRKDPDWYSERFPDAPDDEGSLWPVRKSDQIGRKNS